MRENHDILIDIYNIIVLKLLAFNLKLKFLEIHLLLLQAQLVLIHMKLDEKFADIVFLCDLINKLIIILMIAQNY